MPFGEFLVTRGSLERSDLLRVLQYQDKAPQEKFGQCALQIGVLQEQELEEALSEWEDMTTLLPKR